VGGAGEEYLVLVFMQIKFLHRPGNDESTCGMILSQIKDR
jgi:hypothetical protein